jgi:8-oxo-dGTP pyrophosphatase MutT (NUDIX family)
MHTNQDQEILETSENTKVYKLHNIEENYKGKYLTHATKLYKSESDPNKQVIWECCNRTNMDHYKKISGVEVIAIIKGSKADDIPQSLNSFEYPSIENLSILIIENFRYPVEKNILEFPAGLIDDHEFEELKIIHNKISRIDDPKEIFLLHNEYDKKLEEICINSAGRELKEETGYIGQFKGFFSPPNFRPLKIFENVFYDPWKSSENAALCVYSIDKKLKENQNPQQELEDAEIIITHEVKLKNLINFISEKIENENYGCSQNLYTFAMGLQFSEFLKTLKI